MIHQSAGSNTNQASGTATGEHSLTHAGTCSHLFTGCCLADCFMSPHCLISCCYELYHLKLAFFFEQCPCMPILAEAKQSFRFHPTWRHVPDVLAEVAATTAAALKCHSLHGNTPVTHNTSWTCISQHSHSTASRQLCQWQLA